MANTPNLNIPTLTEGQANKEATITDGLYQIDALLQTPVKDRDLTAPPGSPTEGDVYLVAAGATGAWAGQDGKLAHYRNAAWVFIAPKEGWQFYVSDENIRIEYDGAAWAQLGGTINVDGTDGVTRIDTGSGLSSGVVSGVATLTATAGGSAAADISGVLRERASATGAGTTSTLQVDLPSSISLASVSQLRFTGRGLRSTSDPDTFTLTLILDDNSELTTSGYDQVNWSIVGDGAVTIDPNENYASSSLTAAGAISGVSGEPFNFDLELMGLNDTLNRKAFWLKEHKFRFDDDVQGVTRVIHALTAKRIKGLKITATTGNIHGTLTVAAALSSGDTVLTFRLAEETGTGRMLSDSDNMSIIHFTNAGTGVTVTVPNTISEGFFCRIVNETGGSITAVGSGGLTIVGDTSVAQNRVADVVRIKNIKASVAAF